MGYENIVVEKRDRVGLIRLNRPQALNALNTPLVGELIAALGAHDHDDGIGATVLTGSEKAFAAGADIKEMAALGFIEAFTREQASEIAAVADMRKPIVAAVSGYCLGGGAELMMMCDIVVAADTARFGSRRSRSASCRAWAGLSGCRGRSARPRRWTSSSPAA